MIVEMIIVVIILIKKFVIDMFCWLNKSVILYVFILKNI